MKRPFAYLLAVGLLTSSVTCAAGEAPSTDKVAADEQSVTHGSVSIAGRVVRYTATAGTLDLTNDAGETTAKMFYIAYTRDDLNDPAGRPITFFYNGGPGSSTIWLHMGGFGPRRVVTADPGKGATAPYRLIENADSLLDVTDEVFVDAVGTGFSRIVGKGEPKDYYGVDADAHAFANFITRFLSKNGRWNSPKYLFGESYGTLRSAIVARYLETESDVDLNGVILLSALLTFEINSDAPDWNPAVDLPYELMLPTLAATAWYHRKPSERPAALEPLLREVEDFAMGDYAQALQAGSTLDPEVKRRVAEKLHIYIGVPVDYLMNANLRVTGSQFSQALLHDSGEVIGRLDTRYSGPSLDPLAETAGYDPQSTALSPVYVALFNDYVRRELHFGQDQRYIPLNNMVYDKWDYGHRPPNADFPLPQSTNVMADLAAAMTYNPNLKVLVNSGYFDLATLYYATDFEMHHLPMAHGLQDNIQYAYYPSGHMIYANPESLTALHGRIAEFIDSTHGRSQP